MSLYILHSSQKCQYIYYTYISFTWRSLPSVRPTTISYFFYSGQTTIWTTIIAIPSVARNCHICSCSAIVLITQTHHHHHTFNGPLSGWASTRKVEPIWILLEQETLSGSGISWAICKSAPRSRETTTPVFYRPDALPAAQPTASKHWRQYYIDTHIHNHFMAISQVYLDYHPQTCSRKPSETANIVFLKARWLCWHSTNSIKAVQSQNTENEQL